MDEGDVVNLAARLIAVGLPDDSAHNLAAWHDYAARINRALPVDHEADERIAAMMARRTTGGSRPLTRRPK